MRALAAGYEKAARRRPVAGQQDLDAAQLDFAWASAGSCFSLQEEVENAYVKAGQVVIAFSDRGENVRGEGACCLRFRGLYWVLVSQSGEHG
ncbi:MAG: hypothetical protein CFE50_11655 [Pseudomonas sp. PGPPP4]|nr:MAG: hypothetical protein CFE50_11655 [Pseudomonas sp. PGPPP4]